MISSLTRTTDAATEPVTLAEAQSWLRIDSDDDAAEITTLITTARQIVEEATARALISQSWKLVQDEWPDDGVIYLRATPVNAVGSVKYYPSSGAAQATLSSGVYHVVMGTEPGFVMLKDDQDWPDVAVRPDAVEVNFTAGAASAAAVPHALRHSVLLVLAHLYEQRSPVNVGNIVNELPFALRHLLESQRVGGWIG